jgi:hypothetical protein
MPTAMRTIDQRRNGSRCFRSCPHPRTPTKRYGTLEKFGRVVPADAPVRAIATTAGVCVGTIHRQFS